MWMIGFENRYELTKDGQVYFHKNGKVNKRTLVKDVYGYYTVNLKIDGKVYCKKIHREVAKLYVPAVDGKEHVNHINGIKDDNRVENLEWCTPYENTKHARDTGLKKKHHKYSTNTTGYYGVIKSGGAFVAQVKRNKKNIYLGSYSSAEEASLAVKDRIDLELKEKNNEE